MGTLNADPIERRLDRCRVHINALQRSAEHFRPNLNRNRVVLYRESEREQVGKIYFHWEIPPWWGVVVGEVVHHLRSALDNVVWQLVLANDEIPGDKHEFPIAKDSAWFAKVAPRKLAGVSRDAFTAIEAAQPYNRSDGKPVTDHFLWSVHQLDVVDKHRLLHVVAAMPETGAYSISQRQSDIGVRVRLEFRPLYDGAELARFTFNEPCTEEVHMQSPIALQIKIAETETTGLFDFPEWLPRVYDAVVRTIEDIVNA